MIPKWTEQQQFTDRNWAIHMDQLHEALSIAWEALETIQINTQEKINEKECAKAMRRIEELGK